MLIDFAISLKCLHNDVQIIRKWYIVNITQPHPHMLNINSSQVTLRTKLLLILLHDVSSTHHISLLITPIERFQVIVIFLFIWPVKFILVYLLTCFNIPESSVIAELGVWLLLEWKILPLVLAEHWRFDVD